MRLGAWKEMTYSLSDAGSTTSLMSLLAVREGELALAFDNAEVEGETCFIAD